MGDFYPFSGCHCTRGYVKRRRTLFGRPRGHLFAERPSFATLPTCKPAVRCCSEGLQTPASDLEISRSCGSNTNSSWKQGTLCRCHRGRLLGASIPVQRLQTHSKDEGHWHCKTCSAEIQPFGATPNRLRTNQQLSFSNHHVQDVCFPEVDHLNSQWILSGSMFSAGLWPHLWQYDQSLRSSARCSERPAVARRSIIGLWLNQPFPAIFFWIEWYRLGTVFTFFFFKWIWWDVALFQVCNMGLS